MKWVIIIISLFVSATFVLDIIALENKKENNKIILEMAKQGYVQCLTGDIMTPTIWTKGECK